MTKRAKATWTATLGLLVGASGVGLFLRLVPARPERAIRAAQNFVDCLRSHEWERAYELTNRQSDVGKNLGEFQGIVHQQWPGAPPAPAQFLAVRPFQSYGNRLRRWVHGQEMDPQEVSLEFSVDGVPFEVRETRVGGEWKVNYFQSHAG